MRHEQRRHGLLLPECQEDILHLFARDGIEGREGLIHQKHVRLQQEGASQADALLLAAAEFMRIAIQESSIWSFFASCCMPCLRVSCRVPRISQPRRMFCRTVFQAAGRNSAA